MPLQQPTLGHFERAVVYSLSMLATCHVTIIKCTTNNGNRHGLDDVKCQEWTYVTQRTNVAVTGASDINELLVERQRGVERHSRVV